MNEAQWGQTASVWKNFFEPNFLKGITPTTPSIQNIQHGSAPQSGSWDHKSIQNVEKEKTCFLWGREVPDRHRIVRRTCHPERFGYTYWTFITMTCAMNNNFHLSPLGPTWGPHRPLTRSDQTRCSIKSKISHNILLAIIYWLLIRVLSEPSIPRMLLCPVPLSSCHVHAAVCELNAVWPRAWKPVLSQLLIPLDSASLAYIDTPPLPSPPLPSLCMTLMLRRFSPASVSELTVYFCNSDGVATFSN